VEFVAALQATNCHPDMFGLHVDRYSHVHGKDVSRNVLVVSGAGAWNDSMYPQVSLPLKTFLMFVENQKFHSRNLLRRV
jgi:hypothetical protein